MPDTLPRLWERRRLLGETVTKKKRLYLDVKYWGELCDSSLGAITDRDVDDLRQILEKLAGEGAIVCPIEFHTFLELLKQRLPDKRKRTAQIIDLLSTGVSVLMPPERVFIEVLRFLQAAPKGPPFPERPHQEVWTKVAYLVGHGELKVKKASPEDAARLNRLFEERLWTIGLVELMTLLGDGLSVDQGWTEKAATRLNAEKGPAREEVKNYRELYLNEIHGVLDVFAPSLGDTMKYLFDQSGADSESVTEEQAERSAQAVIQLLRAVFDKHDLSRSLPTVHVMATLFAHVQWDKGRKYRPNDFADFGHAAAVAYCDAFATERSLGALLRQSKLDQLYGCEILTKPADVIRWLQQ